MMKTVSHHRSGIDPPRENPTSVHYTYWGAVIGVIAGIATLFAVSTGYAATNGHGGALECAAFGSLSTLLLSQPVALAGLAVGAACGAACALVAHLLHQSRSSG